MPYQSKLKLLVISNPTAGKQFKNGPKLPERICSIACHIDYQATQYAGHAQELAKDACHQGYNTIIAAGGDGTIHEVLNGIILSGQPGIRMGVVPVGTANDYAYSLARRPACKEPFSQLVDIGAMTTAGYRRYFANVAGIGFPGRVAELARGMKRLPARLRYTLAILRCMGASYQTDPIELNDLESRSYLMISTAVGMREGSYPLTPNALLDDGLFDLLLVGALRRRDILRYFPRMIRGDIPTTDRRIQTDRKSKITLRSSKPIPLHLDGEDPWVNLPSTLSTGDFQLEIEILPKAIAMELVT